MSFVRMQHTCTCEHTHTHTDTNKHTVTAVSQPPGVMATAPQLAVVRNEMSPASGHEAATYMIITPEICSLQMDQSVIK